MNFLEKPNLPKRLIKTAIVDYRISKKSISTLNSFGIDVVLSCKLSTVAEPVSGHPDMMINHIGNDVFVVASEAYEYYKKFIPNAKLIKGSICLEEKYPYDIRYNAATLDDYLICNSTYTAPEILSENKSKKILNVKQGYSKCSICVVSENAIITSDSGINKVALNNEIDVLKIHEGSITLTGMSHGFIGGTTGLISENMLAVNGNIKLHPDCEKIIEFCKKYDVEVVSLNDDEIVDIGSIIPVSY
jgi:hypothetical protein